MTVTDADETKSAVSYNLSGAGSDLFVIDHNTGLIQQKEAGNLDSERQTEYNLTVGIQFLGVKILHTLFIILFISLFVYSLKN